MVRYILGIKFMILFNYHFIIIVRIWEQKNNLSVLIARLQQHRTEPARLHSSPRQSTARAVLTK